MDLDRKGPIKYSACSGGMQSKPVTFSNFSLGPIKPTENHPWCKGKVDNVIKHGHESAWRHQNMCMNMDKNK